MTWDYRGFFGSDAPNRLRRCSIRDHAEDAVEVLALACGPNAVAEAVVGHSMGVQVALEFCLLRPELVGSLVLLNGTSGHALRTGLQPIVALPWVGELLSTLISAVDPQFGSARIVWVRPRRIACLQGTLRVVRPSSGPSWVHAFRRPAHMLALHGWIAQMHPPLAQRRTVVYASRSGRSASHGRLMDPGHERQILGRLRATTGPRHLELVVFNGEAGGAIMPLAEQLTLFRAAAASASFMRTTAVVVSLSALFSAMIDCCDGISPE